MNETNFSTEDNFTSYNAVEGVILPILWEEFQPICVFLKLTVNIFFVFSTIRYF